MIIQKALQLKVILISLIFLINVKSEGGFWKISIGVASVILLSRVYLQFSDRLEDEKRHHHIDQEIAEHNSNVITPLLLPPLST